jgi:two-component system, LytTR family, sensor histidine kinase LytS
MVGLAENLSSMLGLLGTACFMIVVALIVSVETFSHLKGPRKATLAKVVVGVVLGILAIFGTLWGMKLGDGTVINVRELASMIAGFAAGPIGGAIAGLIGGVHRYTYGGTTAVPCAVSTILIGVISGVISTKISGKWYLVKAAVAGFLLESMAMAMILVFVPWTQASHIVETIAFSMIGANTIGFILWVYLANKLKISQPKKEKSPVSGSKVVASKEFDS